MAWWEDDYDSRWPCLPAGGQCLVSSLLARTAEGETAQLAVPRNPAAALPGHRPQTWRQPWVRAARGRRRGFVP